MSYEDRYGLPLTTTSLRAVDAYVDGVDRLLSVQPGADRCFRAALRSHPPQSRLTRLPATAPNVRPQIRFDNDAL